MASPTGSGTSSGGSGSPNCDQDQRKRKRMMSNRESARRSRMRKQRQLDDLTTQVGQIKKENEQILMNINFTTQLFLNLESENSVLRAQMAELSHRLESLNDIVSLINSSTTQLFETTTYQEDETTTFSFDDGFIDSWSSFPFVHQPIMAAGDLFMC